MRPYKLSNYSLVWQFPTSGAAADSAAPVFTTGVPGAVASAAGFSAPVEVPAVASAAGFSAPVDVPAAASVVSIVFLSSGTTGAVTTVLSTGAPGSVGFYE